MVLRYSDKPILNYGHNSKYSVPQSAPNRVGDHWRSRFLADARPIA